MPTQQQQAFECAKGDSKNQCGRPTKGSAKFKNQLTGQTAPNEATLVINQPIRSRPVTIDVYSSTYKNKGEAGNENEVSIHKILLECP